jgi:hypothetical protein
VGGADGLVVAMGRHLQLLTVGQVWQVQVVVAVDLALILQAQEVQAS